MLLCRWSLGCVNWRLDPGILGLEQETGFALDFHMEKFVNTTAHLDLLLGRKVSELRNRTYLISAPGSLYF